MINQTLRILDIDEIDEVSGGFICGGLCVLGGIGAAIGFFGGGIGIGAALAKL